MMSDAMREAAINRVAEHLNEIKQFEESDRDSDLEYALDFVLKKAALEHEGRGEPVAWITEIHEYDPPARCTHESLRSAQNYQQGAGPDRCSIVPIYTQPPAPEVPKGYTPVKTDTLLWLLSEAGNFEAPQWQKERHERSSGFVGRFWWRTHLREAMLNAAPESAVPDDCEEIGQKIYKQALRHRRGFREDQIGIDDDIWPGIYVDIGKAALEHVGQGEDREFEIMTITNAYESGFGHGADHRTLPNPYTPGTDEHFAYHIGYEKGEDRNPEPPAPEVPEEFLAVKEVMEEDGGYWNTCSGCHNSIDGHSSGYYPYSEHLGCNLGAGCNECGGIGAVWTSGDQNLTLEPEAPEQ